MSSAALVGVEAYLPTRDMAGSLTMHFLVVNVSGLECFPKTKNKTGYCGRIITYAPLI